MADHQHEALTFSDFDQFFTLLRAGGHRFLDKRMFTRKQAGLREFIVMLDRCSNRDRVQPRAIEQVVVVGHALDLRIEAPHVLQASFA
jgi:hypothetical protein